MVLSSSYKASNITDILDNEKQMWKMGSVFD